jgi:hypothetical protein
MVRTLCAFYGTQRTAFIYIPIKQVGVAIKLETCIWEVLSANLGRDTIITEVFNDIF